MDYCILLWEEGVWVGNVNGGGGSMFKSCKYAILKCYTCRFSRHIVNMYEYHMSAHKDL